MIRDDDVLIAARAAAEALRDEPWRPALSDRMPRARWFAMGDPQASLDRVLGVLHAHGLLGPGGRIRSEIGLVSLGDHFDYPGERERVASDGLALLRWLAEHPADQVVILAGNHDLARVCELAHETDADFDEARAAAAALRASVAGSAERVAFAQRFPRVPSPEVVLRDLASFRVAQRTLVQALLLAGRMRLAASGRLRGETEVLMLHAGITMRELELLGLGALRDPEALAARLDAALATAVEHVRDAWHRGEPAALDLAPLHTNGSAGREGGGLLYHRPTNPRSGDAATHPAIDASAPRRFDPRNLPRGLAQVVGHTGHHKGSRELGAWVTAESAAIARGGLRTLRTDGRAVSYEHGIVATQPGEATLYLVDPEMAHPDVGDIPLLEMAAVR